MTRTSSITAALLMIMAHGAVPFSSTQPITAAAERKTQQDEARLAAAEARRARRHQRRLSTAARGQGGVA